MTDGESEYGIHNNGRVIEFSNPFVFLYSIFLIHDEIQPTLRKAFGLGTIHKVYDKHQHQEAERKNDRLSSPKEEIVTPQNSKQQEHFENLEPLGLQGVGFDEAEIVFEFGEEFVHLTMLTTLCSSRLLLWNSQLKQL